MKITISSRQMTVPEDLKTAVERKLKKFDKFFPEGAEAVVVFSRLRDLECLEVTLHYGGTLFRAEERGDSFLCALDRCIDSMERQIRKHKTRLEKRYRGTPYRFVPDGELSEAEDEPEIRIKTFPPKPMSPEEAILQMDLSGHDFFVFRNSESGETCVVYKRHSDSYGLIVPEKA